jgi:hypothetical protein
MRYRTWSMATAVLAVFGWFAPSAAQRPTPRWVFGAAAGYAHLSPDSFQDERYGVDTNGNKLSPFCYGSPAEVALSVYAGKPLGRLFHADALLSGQFGDSGFMCFSSEPRLGSVVTALLYKGHSPGYIYAYTAGRLVFEPGWQRHLVSPRASITAGWIWSKRTPLAIAAAGLSIGGMKTRVTVDAGEEFLWVPYQRLLQTIAYQQRDYIETLVNEVLQTGTEHSRGAYFRVGFQRTVH